ncbi:MAG: 4Fe-4S dicluster domain-containing protein [bacterium]
MILVKRSALYSLLLKNLSQEYRIVAPQRRNGSVEYLPLEKEPVTDIFPPVNSIKEFFFPRSEVMFRFKRKENKLESVPSSDQKKLLLFGVRPCDASALALFDTLFAQEHEDTSYLAKRRASTIICIACNDPRPDCFCTSVGGSPFGTANCDVLAVEADDGFLLDFLSPSGSDLVRAFGGREASEDEHERLRQLENQAKSRMIKQFDLELTRAKVRASFEKEFWDSFSAPCVSCSICTYVCPTCHCFDITDVKTKEGADRVKTWDSCMSPLFTLHASGHNPRQEKYRRWRQRIFHKFQYLPENIEILGCVGCGRCVTHCPVGMDIRRMLQIISGKKAKPMGVTTGE